MQQRSQTVEMSQKLFQLRRDLLEIERQVEALRVSIGVLETQLTQDDNTRSAPEEERLVARIVDGVLSRLAPTSSDRRNDRQYLREKEAAEYLGVSVFSLRSWRSKGSSSGPPYTRLGRIVVYSVTDLEAHMRARMISNRAD
jgi:hypothetical protein